MEAASRDRPPAGTEPHGDGAAVRGAGDRPGAAVGMAGFSFIQRDTALSGGAIAGLAAQLSDLRARLVALLGLSGPAAEGEIAVEFQDGKAAPRQRRPGLVLVTPLRAEAPGVGLERALVELMLAEGCGADPAKCALLVDGLLGHLKLLAEREAQETDRKARVNDPVVALAKQRQDGGRLGLTEFLQGPRSGDDPTYPLVAASFVGFLLKRYGPRKFAAFAAAFDPTAPDAAARGALERPMSVLEQEWLGSLVPEASKGMGLFGFVGRALGMMAPYVWPLGLVMVLVIAVQLAYGLLMPIALKLLFDEGIANQNVRFLIWIVAALAVGFLANAAGGLTQDFVASKIGTGVMNDLRRRMFDHIQSLSTHFYVKADAGGVLAHFSNDLAVIENAVVRAVPSLLMRMVLIAGSVILLFVIEWRLALVTLIALPLAVLLPRPFGPRASKASYERKQDDAKLAAVVQENLSGHLVIRAFRLQDHRRRQFNGVLGTLAGSSMRTNLYSALVGRLTNLGVGFVQLLVITVGAVLSIYGYITGGGLIGFIGLLLNVGGAAGGLTEVIPTLIQASGSMQRIDDLLAERPRVEEAEKPIELPRLAREIRFDDVTFSYSGEEVNLENVDLAIERGKAVAFVGPSGSGKSTALGLLMRLYDVNEGRVLIDGVDIRDGSEESLRRQMGVVLQDSVLFNTTVRENIRMGRLDATDGEIEAAARAAEAHDLIMALPQGYDTVVGERGGRLSGGQRQRVAIARALLRHPEVLVLDEATSALDPGTEAAINQTFQRLAGRHTIVAVTHRLAPVANMDRIFVMHRGRLAEAGGHEELLARQGIYHELWQKQSGITVSDDGQSAEITPERLRGIPFLAELDQRTLEELAETLVVERAPEGRVVVQEGDPSDRFYIIARGTVEMVTESATGEEIVLAALSEGDYFGEIGLLEDVPENARVRTRLPCVFLTLQRQQFIDLLEGRDELRAVIERAIDERLQAKLDELIYKRVGLA